MKRLLFVFTVLATAISLAQNTTGISGTVTDAQTADPIAGARVHTRCGMAYTDSTGNYLIGNLRPGEYVVGAWAANYQGEVYPETVTVVQGEVTENINFQLEPTQQCTCGSISGEVTDAVSGFIVRGAVVTAANDEISREVLQGCRGYRIGALPAGKYWVSAVAPSHEPGSYPESVEVVAGQVTGDIDFTLERDGTPAGGIAGTVTNAETSDPIFGAHVLAVGLYHGRANTDSAGDYLIRNLMPGTYAVQARARGFQPSEWDTVVVAESLITEDVDFALQPCIGRGSSAITGVVTDSATGEPVFGAHLFAWGPSGQGMAVSDSSGNYLIGNLRPGSYVVRACARYYYPAVYDDTVTIAADDTADGIDFVLVPLRNPYAGIGGFAYNGLEQGEIVRAQVKAIGPNGSFYTYTNRFGQYLFDNLEPGEYRIEASAPGYEDGGCPEVVVLEPYAVADFISPALYTLTGVEEGQPVTRSATASMLQACPNPVRGGATTNWQVAQPGRVVVRVVDNTGRVVRTIHDGYQDRGTYVGAWDGTDDSGQRIANGIFFYQLSAPGCQSIQKTVLVMR